MRYYQTKINRSGLPDSLITTKDGAGEYNSARNELTNAVTRTGQTPAPADGTGENLFQLGRGMMITSLGAASFQDNGTTGWTYDVTPWSGSLGFVMPETYDQLHGAIITFRATNTNNADVSVRIGQDTGSLLGYRSIASDIAGTNLVGGEIVDGEMPILQYNHYLLSKWILIGKYRPDYISDYDVPFLHVEDQKGLDVDGGTFNPGAWYTRDLNTVVENTIPGASLAIPPTSQITLPAGTYRLNASAGGWGVNVHQIAFWNDSDLSFVHTGTTENTSDTITTDVITTWSKIINAKFTITSNKNFELQHQCSRLKSGTGFGFPVGAGWTDGTHNVYAIVTIEQLIKGA